jgi:hypothetical protein
VSSILAACLVTLCTLTVNAGAAESPLPSDPPHVVFVVGEGEYGSQESMPALANVLATQYGFRVRVLIDAELDAGPENSIDGLEALRDADLAIFYMRFLYLGDLQILHGFP